MTKGGKAAKLFNRDLKGSKALKLEFKSDI